MDQFKYRSKARILAITDIVLSSISLGWSLLLLALAAMASEVVAEVKQDPDLDDGDGQEPRAVPDISPEDVKIVWAVAILATFFSGLQVMAAIKLLSATQEGKDSATAFRLCRFWRGVTIFFTTIMILNLLFASQRDFFRAVFLLASIMIRCAALYLVQQFIQELRMDPNSSILPAHQIPGAVYSYNLPPAPPPPAYEEYVKQ